MGDNLRLEKDRRDGNPNYGKKWFKPQASGTVSDHNLELRPCIAQIISRLWFGRNPCSLVTVLRRYETESRDRNRNSSFLFRSHSPPSQYICKLNAICLHYSWLCVFAWLLIDLLHIYRMLTEMKDINHGSMKFYISMAYGGPALIVALSLGIKSELYSGHNL